MIQDVDLAASIADDQCPHPLIPAPSPVVQRDENTDAGTPSTSKRLRAPSECSDHRPIADCAGGIQSEARELHSYLSCQVSRLAANDGKVSELRKSLESTSRKLDDWATSMNQLIHLNVGGMKFTVPYRTLVPTGDADSFFYRILSNGTRGEADGDRLPLDRDSEGNIIIDRDPITFKHVLNYLRGYRKFHMLVAEELSLLRSDAAYYGLTGLSALLADSEDESGLFAPGPGVSIERKRIRVAYCVGFVGDRFLMTGRHAITLEIDSAEYLGIGVASDSCLASDQEYHKVCNSCVYYMTGILYSNFPLHKKEENLEKYEAGDRVTIVLDMTARIVEFHLKNSVKVLSVGSAQRLKFAVAMKLGSKVRIVQDEQNSNFLSITSKELAV